MTFASVSAVLVAFMYTLVEAGHWVQHVQHNFKLDGPAMMRVYSVSLEHCHEECFVRAACKSFSYYRTLQKCLLSGMDGTTVSGVEIPGVVTSEKRYWSEQQAVVGCELCQDVCDISSGMQCITKGCGSPGNLNDTSNTQGNMYVVGAKVLYVCSDDPTAYNTSECLPTGHWAPAELVCQLRCSSQPTVHGGTFVTPYGVGEGAIGTAQCNNHQALVPVTSAVCQTSGQWNETTLVCWNPVMDDFNGENKRFVNQATGKYWHNDGGTSKRITVYWQSSDSFVDFDMSFQADLSYKFWDFNAFVCDGYGTTMMSLHTNTSSCPDEDHTHFYIFVDDVTDTYLIKSKATDRVVRIDENSLVTSIHNLADERAIFQILD